MGSEDLPRRPRVTPAYPELTQKMPIRTCPRCGGQCFMRPEGLQVCVNCKMTWQPYGHNYRILRNS